MATLSDQVGDAAGLLGLLLALNTLFTAEQAKRLAEERTRTGGARDHVLRTVRVLSVGLAIVTVAALVMLLPLVLDVLGAIGGDDWEPVLGVFGLTWLLLVGLFIWQVALAARSA